MLPLIASVIEQTGVFERLFAAIGFVATGAAVLFGLFRIACFVERVKFLDDCVASQDKKLCELQISVRRLHAAFERETLDRDKPV